MVKNRPIVTMIILLLTMMLFAAGAFIAYILMNDTAESKEPTIDDILEATWETEEITTNLKNNDLIRTQFRIQLTNKEAREEIEKRDFQVYNIIINELAQMEKEDFNESDGLTKLEEQAKEKINQLLQAGLVERVYTTKKMIQ